MQQSSAVVASAYPPTVPAPPKSPRLLLSGRNLSSPSGASETCPLRQVLTRHAGCTLAPPVCKRHSRSRGYQQSRCSCAGWCMQTNYVITEDTSDLSVMCYPRFNFTTHFTAVQVAARQAACSQSRFFAAQPQASTRESGQVHLLRICLSLSHSNTLLFVSCSQQRPMKKSTTS